MNAIIELKISQKNGRNEMRVDEVSDEIQGSAPNCNKLTTKAVYRRVCCSIELDEEILTTQKFAASSFFCGLCSCGLGEGRRYK